MTKGINKAIIIGNLGQDPEIKTMQNGNMLANLSVATTESWKDKQTGEQQKQTEWHRVIVFGQPAEFISRYAQKGNKVYVEGKIKTRKWTDKENIDRYTTEIHVDFGGRVELIGSSHEPAVQSNQAQYQHQTAKQNGYQPSTDFDKSEIPF